MRILPDKTTCGDSAPIQFVPSSRFELNALFTVILVGASNFELHA